MKSKIKILSLAISALLMAGVAGYPMPGYAAQPIQEEPDYPDANNRGTGERKITVCHVPKGNPENKHTIHIAYNAWIPPAHGNGGHIKHTNTKGPDYKDYLGDCNPPPPKDCKLHVVSSCTGADRIALLTKVRSYFEPITVADSVLDDYANVEAVVTQASQCLDKGDSSDSGKGGAKGQAKGGGHDSVSAPAYHQIRGCQNTATDTYRDKLKAADIAYDTAKGIKDPIVVSDSSLDDADVWKEYKECVKDTSTPDKLDPVKTGPQVGDTGHKQHILQSCGATQDLKLKVAIAAYKAKASTKDIILTDTAYNDVGIKAAIDLCVSDGAKDTLVDDCDGPVNPLGDGGGTGISGRQNFREIIKPR